jgi:hypothetical protein
MAKAKDSAKALRADESFPIFTAQELAEFLQVQPDTLRKWRVAGTGPKFIQNTARSIVYLRKSVYEWLEGRERVTQVSYKRKKRGAPKAVRRGRADDTPQSAKSPGA